MTTIVTNRKVMASDRLIVQGYSKIETDDKLVLLKRGKEKRLVGIAGALSDALRWRAWYSDNWYKAPSKQEPSPGGDCDGLVLEPTGHVYLYSQGSGIPIEILGPFVGIGTGRDWALGALSAGADIKTAMAITESYDAYSGGGIHLMDFSD